MNIIDKKLKEIDTRIEALLNKWPISGGVTERTNKKSEVQNWLNNFVSTEIEAMLLILEKLDVVSQYKINCLLKDLSEELRRYLESPFQRAESFLWEFPPVQAVGTICITFARNWELVKIVALMNIWTKST